MRERPPVHERDETDQDTYTTELDIPGSETTPSIMQVVASVANVPPGELPPLHDIMDPDGLETLLSSAQDPVSITFQYQDYLVTVSNDDDISVKAL